MAKMGGEEEKSELEELEAQKSENAELKKSVAEQMTAIKTLTGKLSEQGDMYANPDYLDYLEKKAQGGQQAGAGKFEGAEQQNETQAIDLDQATGSALAKHITDNILTALVPQLESVNKTLQENKQGIVNAESRMDFEIDKVNNPGLRELLSTDEGKEKFIAESKKHDTMRAGKLWKLMSNEEKVAQVDAAVEAKETAEVERKATVEKFSVPDETAEPLGGTPQEITEKVYDALTGGADFIR